MQAAYSNHSRRLLLSTSRGWFLKRCAHLKTNKQENTKKTNAFVGSPSATSIDRKASFHSNEARLYQKVLVHWKSVKTRSHEGCHTLHCEHMPRKGAFRFSNQYAGLHFRSPEKPYQSSRLLETSLAHYFSRFWDGTLHGCLQRFIFLVFTCFM